MSVALATAMARNATPLKTIQPFDCRSAIGRLALAGGDEFPGVHHAEEDSVPDRQAAECHEHEGRPVHHAVLARRSVAEHADDQRQRNAEHEDHHQPGEEGHLEPEESLPHGYSALMPARSTMVFMR